MRKYDDIGWTGRRKERRHKGDFQKRVWNEKELGGTRYVQ